ncbi:MAG: class I SAM-dependent methyltransferase [Pseudomonadota bacterium]
MTRYVNPVPPHDAIVSYYNDESVNRIIQDIYRKRSENAGNWIVDDKVAFIADMIPRQEAVFRVLEVGCNSGWFLSGLRHVLSERGYAESAVELTGIDIDAEAIVNRVDAEVVLINASAEEFFGSVGNRYDLIVHFELIEHLADPSTFCLQCRKALAPGGAMAFTCPNILGLEMLVGYNQPRLLAHAIFPPVHLTGFSLHNITHFLLRQGFAVERVETPGKLDVEMAHLSRGEESPDILGFVSGLTHEQRGGLQRLISGLRASSHMAVVARNPEQQAG